MQLRRRGREKLAFHSANFGVWEQWELVAGEPKQAWNTQRMGLRNRQLQQVSGIVNQHKNCLSAVPLTQQTCDPAVAHGIGLSLMAGHSNPPHCLHHVKLDMRCHKADPCQCLQVVLTVDVVRVGTYALLPNASMTSRSLIPLQGDVSENEELMKMSGLMIYVRPHWSSTATLHSCPVILMPQLSKLCYLL